MNIVTPSILPGFLELLPNDQLAFNEMKSIIERNFKKYAYLPLDTPNIEKSEVLLAKGGGETSKQVYFIDRKERDMALRFDLTVPLARYVAEHYHELAFPFRRYHIGKVYRGERNQRGRFREFYQCDIDIIGDRALDIRNDAEIPAVIFDIFKEMNFTEMTFHINNRKVLNGLLNAHGIEDFVGVLRGIDKLSKVGEETTREILLEVLGSEENIDLLMNFITYDGDNASTLSYLKGLEITDETFLTGLTELETVYEYMLHFGIPEENIKIDLSITRGLDYYTGTVYETFLDDFKSLGSVCSGGRYEDLANNYTKQVLPGVGISIGLSRLFYQLREANRVNISVKPVCDLLIIPMAGAEKYGLQVLNGMRKRGVISQIYLEQGKMKAKFSYANKLNIPYVMVLGEEEMEKSLVSLKDMHSGEQRSMTAEEAAAILNAGL
ncbi:MAG: histidine--tRNA ligase [Tissierellia bacterium]|nr:histidine--tRNA ligase [Tissierellia bacterium]